VLPNPRLAAIVDRITFNAHILEPPTSSKPAPSPTGCALRPRNLRLGDERSDNPTGAIQAVRGPGPVRCWCGRRRQPRSDAVIVGL